jgi:hypothetical protein
MSGVTQGVKFKPFFAVESEDQCPRAVSIPAPSSTRHQSRVKFTRITVNDVFQVIDLDLLGFRFFSLAD